jgi:hypothetical protein
MLLQDIGSEVHVAAFACSAVAPISMIHCQEKLRWVSQHWAMDAESWSRSLSSVVGRLRLNDCS